MAYVLGYFSADGTMFTNSRGSRYIQFTSKDRELLEKVKKLLRSKHFITLRRRKEKSGKSRNSYELEFGSKEIYDDLLQLGLFPRKATRLKLPDIPKGYFRHFARGYFDGDGCISYGYYKRKNRNNRSVFILLLRFISGSRSFLKSLSQKLILDAKIGAGCLTGRERGYYLGYSKNDTLRLFDYMYHGVSQDQFLLRKHKKFQEAFRIIGAVA